MSLAREVSRYWPRAYVVATFFPYQLALGLSLRRLEGLHLRVYVGPFKLAVGTVAPTPPSGWTTAPTPTSDGVRRVELD